MKQLQRLITVIGSSRAREEELTEARRVGEILAREGVTLISGGRGGVMESVAKAHAGGGGLSIGLLPDDNLQSANDYNTLSLPLGIGYARNLPNVLAGRGVIVVGGSVGTLTELGYAIQYRRPILMLSYIKGVSSLSREFLAEIAPYADLTDVPDADSLGSALTGWLGKVFESLSSVRNGPLFILREGEER